MPPCGDVDMQSEFPRVGVLDERVRAHRDLVAALGRSCEEVRHPWVRVAFVDVTNELSDSDGALLPSASDDGCHANRSSAAVIQAAVAQALTRPQLH
jgi:hypothetical protein